VQTHASERADYSHRGGDVKHDAHVDRERTERMHGVQTRPMNGLPACERRTREGE